MTGALALKRAAEYLGITEDTLRGWIKRGIAPPHFRNGRGIYFRLAALEKWMRDKEECA